MSLHALFDVLAALSALAMTAFAYRWRLQEAGQRIEAAGPLYAVALVLGAAAGGFGFGTLNLWISGAPGISRSIAGALAGAILAVELYKAARGIRGSTGLIFVPGFAVSVIAGRWGCFLSGMDDHTHGTATGLPWGHDFGDGVARHPVQIYESLAMAAFLAVALVLMQRRDARFMRNGFHLMVLAYAGQRFLWEFLKPYGAVLGPLNLFHLLCAALVVYSLAMLARAERA